MHNSCFLYASVEVSLQDFEDLVSSTSNLLVRLSEELEDLLH